MHRSTLLRVFIRIGLIALFCGLAIYLSTFSNFLRKGKINKPISADSTPEGILKILSTIKDPEIGVTIVDLGLVRNIEVKPDNKAIITIIFTSPACPLIKFISTQIKEKVKAIDGIEEVEVNIDKTTMWNPDMITEKGKMEMEMLYK